MASSVKVAVFASAILMAGLLVSVSNAQQQQTPTKAVQLTGLAGVKNSTGGSLTIENGNLRFTHSRSNSDLAPSAVQDVVTGSDSQRVIRGSVGTLKMFAPYESGRFLSLFRSKLDTLTIKYHDSDGGLHGAIFTMAMGKAEPLKKLLVAQGAHRSIPVQDSSSGSNPKTDLAKEQKP